MGSLICRPSARRCAVGRSELLTRCGAVLCFIIVAGAWHYLRPLAGTPWWQRAAAGGIVMALVACLALLLRTDPVLLRAAILVCLITLAELMAGGAARLASESTYLAYGMILSSSSVLALSLRNTWQSVLVTTTFFLTVHGYALMSSLAKGLGPTAAIIVLTVWIMMLGVRLATPAALAHSWSDLAVRQQSIAAHGSAQCRRRAAARNARRLHDTVLRTLTVVGREGAGTTLGELHAMLDAGTAGGGTAPSREGTGAVPCPGDLSTTLHGLAESRSKEGFRIDVHGITGRLPAEVHAALLAAADECIVNAQRHAGTDHVDVLLSRTDKCVSVVVSDSGGGFNPAAVPSDRLGVLWSILARMHEAGGRAQVFSAPGRGTTVVLEARVPGTAVLETTPS
jgi:signal transduction histidine kinase